MKLNRILTVLLVAGLIFAFTSCGDKNAPRAGENAASESISHAMEGRYVIADITDDPDGTTFAELEAMYREMNLEIANYLYMEFLDGVEFKIVLFGQEETAGTYTRDGDILTLTAGGETTTAAVSGEKIIWTYENGAKLVFGKG